MIQSMTGYGKTVVTYKEKKINVEIKSLNSKALDLSTRIAPLYREKEMEIRSMISKTLERGKVDFSIWIDVNTLTAATPINKVLVENYYNQIKRRYSHVMEMYSREYGPLLNTNVMNDNYWSWVATPMPWEVEGC